MSTAYENWIFNARQGPHSMLGATCLKTMATSATSDVDVSVIHELDDKTEDSLMKDLGYHPQGMLPECWLNVI